jgi:hypothetical protein
VNTLLLARKGEAVPTGLSSANRQSLAYFAARRTVTFSCPEPQIPLTPNANEYGKTLSLSPRRVASILLTPKSPVDGRRRFAFRLDQKTHARFCAASTLLDCSRQKLLERALEHYLADLDDADIPATTVAPAVPRLV